MVGWEGERTLLESDSRFWVRVRSDLIGGRQILGHSRWIWSRYSYLVRVCGGVVAESVGNSVQAIGLAKRVFAELDALGVGSANMIYLGE